MEPLIPSEPEIQFDAFLDEIFGKTIIAGYEFETSRALKELDPIAYTKEFYNWLDEQGGE